MPRVGRYSGLALECQPVNNDTLPQLVPRDMQIRNDFTYFADLNVPWPWQHRSSASADEGPPVASHAASHGPPVASHVSSEKLDDPGPGFWLAKMLENDRALQADSDTSGTVLSVWDEAGNYGTHEEVRRYL